MSNPFKKLLDADLSKVIPGMEMMGERRKLIDAVEELQNEYGKYVKDKPETKKFNLDITAKDIDYFDREAGFDENR